MDFGTLKLYASDDKGMVMRSCDVENDLATPAGEGMSEISGVNRPEVGDSNGADVKEDEREVRQVPSWMHPSTGLPYPAELEFLTSNMQLCTFSVQASDCCLSYLSSQGGRQANQVLILRLSAYVTCIHSFSHSCFSGHKVC